MPMYGFRCPECGLEFEVSRKMSEATKPATCPLDGVVGERIFTAVATIMGGRRSEPPPDPAGAAAPKPQNQWSHFGHSHGFGTGGHAHGAPRPATPKPEGS
jgi:putative FmdB family regulatory protein